MSTPQTLNQLPVGASATVVDVAGDSALQQRLLEMGLIPGAALKVVRFAPLGDPIEIKIMGYSLSLRRSDAQHVQVST
jgi:Fe2+ transport system protein FeoA